MKLVCKHCGHELFNDDVSGLSNVRRVQLWVDDQNKSQGDITIYYISWRKNQDDEWLSFPGLFYPGLTEKSAEERAFGSGGHFYKAFNNPSTSIEHTIKKYGLNLERARQIFKVEVLQIVKYQGSKEATMELASKIEKFWIGYFHSQFYEFGRNIESGGSDVRESIILQFNILDNALKEACKLPRVGDIQRKQYVYNRVGLKETQNRILDNSIEFWYRFSECKFENAIRLKRFEIIKILFEQGYKAAYIADEINADRHDVVQWIIEDIYNDRYPGFDYKKIHKAVLSEKIISSVSNGRITPDQILEDLSGLVSVDAVKHHVRQNLGGWDNLINNYAPKEDYWIIAKSLLEHRQNEIKLGRASDYTAVEFAQALGSNTVHTSSAIKFIKRKLNTDMTWIEIRTYILSGVLP